MRGRYSSLQASCAIHRPLVQVCMSYNGTCCKNGNEIPTILGYNALTTGNPFWGGELLGISIGREFGAL